MKSDLLLDYLESVHREFTAIKSGEVASYIPELFKADPEWFGISLVTVDGHVYQAGETRQHFTIQSISKVITYGIGLEDSGVDAVLNKIDVEPSGEAFNQISLEPNTGRPRNPMINAGAIAAMAFVGGDSPDVRLKRILDTYHRYLGHSVEIDQEVYSSEKSTGHRNRAIAHMLRNYDIIESDTDDLLDLYFKQCSILVNCRDLALIAASLANDGVNPVTGIRAIKSQYVPKLLSIMSSCGMYDFSGAWVYEVGMPAKSGVAGGVMAVLPGQLGLAVFSPRLDDRGNSVRGIAVCKRISSDFGLHMFHAGRATAESVIHSTYTAAAVSSRRYRNARQAGILKDQGKKIVVLELQGDLMFASAEIVVSETVRLAESADFLILDFLRIATVNRGAMNLLSHLVEHCCNNDKTLLFTNVRDIHNLAMAIKQRVPRLQDLSLFKHTDLDKALEWCEDQLLAEHLNFSSEPAPLSAQAYCAGFSDQELDCLEAFLEPRSYTKGSMVCKAGEPANELYFILSGQVSVLVPVGYKRGSRITTMSAGAAFGEMALLDRGVRSADVVADTDLICQMLNYELLESDTRPLVTGVRLKLVTNIGRALSGKLRQATDEIKSLRS